MIRPKLTAVGSGKGGTGKTLCATALAQILARDGERVLLCDADLGLSNATVQLGLDTGGDLSGVLSGRTSIAQAIVPVGEGAGHGDGFDILAAPAGSGALANLDQAVAASLIAKLRQARLYDRVLLDLSAGVDATTMTFAAHADEALLVMTPDPAALTDAYAFVKILLRMGGRTPGVIVNMAESESDARRAREALAKTCQAFLKTAPNDLGFVPRDPQAQASIRQQRSLVALYPQSLSVRALIDIARTLRDDALGNVAALSVR